MKIMLVSFLPELCPNCGSEFRLNSAADRQDFYASASHTCSCGMKFEYVDEKDLLHYCANGERERAGGGRVWFSRN